MIKYNWENIIMTFEEKVKNIKTRFNNNNFNLDQEDIFIIFPCLPE